MKVLPLCNLICFFFKYRTNIVSLFWIYFISLIQHKYLYEIEKKNYLKPKHSLYTRTNRPFLDRRIHFSHVKKTIEHLCTSNYAQIHQSIKSKL